MTITMTHPHSEDLTLTTEHSQSSYGMPVLVYQGTAYGPGDLLPAAPGWMGGGQQYAWHVVLARRQYVHDHGAAEMMLGCSEVGGAIPEYPRPGHAPRHWEHGDACQAIGRYIELGWQMTKPYSGGPAPSM